MAQCAGTTQKGGRCKREAKEASEYCSIHQEQAAHPRPEPASAPETASQPRDPDWMLKAALGLAAIAAIVLFRIRR